MCFIVVNALILLRGEMSQRWLVLLLLVEALAVSGGSVVFQDCGSLYDLEEVNIDGCDFRVPCYITLGDHIPVSVHFYADFASYLLDQDVIININLVNMEADVTEPCEIAVCPVPTDCVTSFTSVMTVPRNMALNQRGWLRWRVYNERGLLVLCYSVLVQTQNTLQRLLRQNLNSSELNITGDLALVDMRNDDVKLLQLVDAYYQEPVSYTEDESIVTTSITTEAALTEDEDLPTIAVESTLPTSTDVESSPPISLREVLTQFTTIIGGSSPTRIPDESAVKG